jgi:internalin A
VLRLDGNQLTALPDAIGNLAALTTIGLQSNQLTALPDAIGNLAALTVLDLGGNRLTTLPATFGNLDALTSLFLVSNQFAEVPDALRSLSALTLLGLSQNQLTSVPDWIGTLTGLTVLGLGKNELTGLPDSLGQLTALTMLRLDGNRLTSLPGWVGNLTALTELQLQGNQFRVLNARLGELTSLITLDVKDNQLTGLPESLGKLATLTALQLSGNPWRSPLLEITEGGTAAVKAYLSLISDSAAEMWMSKLLVVGEGAVGKTSLVKALASQQYDPGEPTTHGIHVVEVTFDHPQRAGTQMHLSAWDFGGQDIYHATHQFFLTDRSLFLLLWNARQGWEQAKLPYWLEIIKARAPHARVILVATHSEGRPVDLPLADLRATYPQIVGSASVDNSTGEGVAELRRLMADEAAQLPMMGSRWPVTWITAVQAVRDYQRQYATPEALYSELDAAGVTDRSHQTYLLRALHLLGDILYFDDDAELSEIIILRPQWVNVYISRVLDSHEVADKKGLLTRQHERELWADLDYGLRDPLLRMMEKVDLSFRVPDDPEVAGLVVERLPWERQPYEGHWNAALTEPGSREIRVRYQLDTLLPPGIPTWFIAREHRFSTDIHWRTGALLRRAGQSQMLALIIAERQNRTVDLAVRGSVPQEFFSILKDGFESTLSRYRGLRATKFVPCNCGMGNGDQPGQPCQHLYEYDLLVQRLERGRNEVECARSLRMVNVAELLLGLAPTDTDKILSRLDRIDHGIRDARVEAAWTYRDLLKNLRRGQALAEAVCPSIFTLTHAPGRWYRPGMYRLDLRLYCEQPGEFHATPEAPYSIEQPTQWLRNIAPYLSVMLSVLKNASPLVGPVLGIAADKLATQLSNEVDLMSQLISELPGSLPTGSAPVDALQESQSARPASGTPGTLPADTSPAGDLQHPRPAPSASHPASGLPADPFPAGDLQQAQLDVDYRALHAVLKQADPAEHWGGLSRITAPEGDVLWLCREHAGQYKA